MAMNISLLAVAICVLIVSAISVGCSRSDGHRWKRSVDKIVPLAYSLTLDAESNFQLYWTPIFRDKYVEFRVDLRNISPQSWFAIGFSDDGQWRNANLCVAWEDWKGVFHVQVRPPFTNIQFQLTEIYVYKFVKLTVPQFGLRN